MIAALILVLSAGAALVGRSIGALDDRETAAWIIVMLCGAATITWWHMGNWWAGTGMLFLGCIVAAAILERYDPTA